MDHQNIIEKLPYSEPFLFVERINRLDADSIEGEYRFPKDHWFYRGHFKDHPVTPGVILTECCAQIGLACFGIFLETRQNGSSGEITGFALSESQMLFENPVFPGELVRVQAEKIYYRFGKLKTKVRMSREDGSAVCRGTLSGIATNQPL